MTETLTQLGVGGIFAILILKEVFLFLKSRKDDSKPFLTEHKCLNSLLPRIDRIDKGMDHLLELHNVKDNDGTPIWYNKRSLEEAISKLAQVIDNQNRFLMKVINKIENVESTVNKIDDKL